MIKKIKITILLLIFTIIIFISNYSLAVNFATTVGTENYAAFGTEAITTTNLTYTAAQYYEDMGYYGTKKLVDPSYLLLVSNLVGKVQLFCTHGSVDSISYKSYTGITTLETHMEGSYEMIGVPDVARSMWKNNTALVTYIACNTAGENGEYSYDSLACKTVSDGGVRLSLGFTTEVPYGVSEKWSERYHSKLKQGAGVWDSMDYANSDPYFAIWAVMDKRDIRKCCLFKDEFTDENLVINKYINSELNSISDTYSIDLRKDENILKSKIAIKENADDAIAEYLSKYDSNFNIKDYEIGRSSCCTVSIDKEEKQIDYIYLGFKLGDFYTNKGYVAKVENGNVIAIYDNMKDSIKNNDILLDREKFYVSNNSINLMKMKENILSQSKLENVSIEEDVKYYYDIENDKKYVIIPVRSEVDDGNGGKDLLVDTVTYEI